MYSRVYVQLMQFSFNGVLRSTYYALKVQERKIMHEMDLEGSATAELQARANLSHFDSCHLHHLV